MSLPSKKGNTDKIPPIAFKYLCTAMESYQEINKFNGDGGKISGKHLEGKLLQCIENVPQDGYATSNKILLERNLETRAINLKCEKALSEDQMVRWTNHYKIKLWFKSWEKELVDQGFAS